MELTTVCKNKEYSLFYTFLTKTSRNKNDRMTKTMTQYGQTCTFPGEYLRPIQFKYTAELISYHFITFSNFL